MEIEYPSLIIENNTLAMFCKENRIARELYWAGFGFHVWCQILTHLVRAAGASTIVIDEPEIYLHPELQRKLLSILRALGPDVVIATHSSELVQEAEATDIAIVDKRKRSAQRISDVHGVETALEALGSVQNLALTELSRTRRILLVEGNEMRILRLFARRLGYGELASAIGLAILSLGGHPSPERVKAVCLTLRQTIGDPSPSDACLIATIVRMKR